ncbi:MAG: magnesium chelatase subunit H, partial [Betaproteobacteria bacterium]|nr:magnesium chelatase subunit H [Betaproteobacteria bacterium]
MTPKHTLGIESALPDRTSSAAGSSLLPAVVRVALITMDAHLASATERARIELKRELPGLHLSVHTASDWAHQPQRLVQCQSEIARADIVIVTMLFMQEHFSPILAHLESRREHCDAMVCAMSAPEVVRLTRMGSFDMGKPASGAMALLKRLRGNKGPASSGGAQQMKMLRRLPKLLRFIPGTAQDIRAYFLTLQYWLGGSEQNMQNMLRLLISRYTTERIPALRGRLSAQAPIEYPDVGVYHPRMSPQVACDASKLPRSAAGHGRVGLLLLRSYLLAKNTAHYDGVIAALEAKGLQVIPAFAAGLDARPAIERYFMHDGVATVDAVVSLSGFSLVGGPAYNDARAAQELLQRLDVPYVAAHPLEFQTIEQWGDSTHGLLPVENTIMVAIPELDGAVAPIVFGGRPGAAGTVCKGCHRGCRFTQADAAMDMHSCPERAEMLASRVARQVALRRAERRDRKLAIVLFNFPPNGGSVGTAAHLSVFESLHSTLGFLADQGYAVAPPKSVDELRSALIDGNSSQYGTDANVHARIAVDDHVRHERWLTDIEAQWGPAPGKHLANGHELFVLGAQFGNVFVGLQPPFGYEGDPMRLLFEHGFCPTHAFSAFYRWIREDFHADAVLHFGTHGALEFMPGKQTGMSGKCWPDRLIGDLPNFYLYAANNPSEGALAKRRSAATLVSYLTPAVTSAGLYRVLVDLKSSIDRFRQLDPSAERERKDIGDLIVTQAATLDMEDDAQTPQLDLSIRIERLSRRVLELERTLIPCGLHVLGRPMPQHHRAEMLAAAATLSATEGDPSIPDAAINALAAGCSVAQTIAQCGVAVDATATQRLDTLEGLNRALADNQEFTGLLRALDGRYVPPAPGGDVLRTPEVLPTGRNVHGFDPFRIPSAFAVREGVRLADLLIDRHRLDGHDLPETIAMVLWGTDNLKSEGSPIAQALALMGAAPRFDSYGRLTGAVLLPLTELHHPRIDVVVTLSGIFRDLLPL